jgi:hypothetical protein
MQNEFVGGDEVCRMEHGARYGSPTFNTGV